MSRYAEHELITWEQAAVAAVRIRELRGTRTQAWLSEASGLSPGAIAHAEGKRARLTKVNADRLARALGVSVGELLEGDGE